MKIKNILHRLAWLNSSIVKDISLQLVLASEAFSVHGCDSSEICLCEPLIACVSV